MTCTGARLKAASLGAALLMVAACAGEGSGAEDSAAAGSEATASPEGSPSSGTPEPSASVDDTEEVEEEPASRPPARIEDRASGFSFVLPRRVEPQVARERVGSAVVTRRVYEAELGEISQTVAIVTTPTRIPAQEPSAVADQVVAGLTSAGGDDVRIADESEISFVGMPGWTGTISFTSTKGDVCHWRLTTASLGRTTFILQTLRFAPRGEPTRRVDDLHATLEGSSRLAL